MGNEEAKILEHIIDGLKNEKNDTFINAAFPDIEVENLNILPKFQKVNLVWQKILALGINVNQNFRETPTVPKENQRITKILASLDIPFALSYSCNSSGVVDFNIGFQNDNGGIIANSLLCASFGFVDMLPVSKDFDPVDNESWTALCIPNHIDVDALDKINNLFEPSNWADEISAAIIGTKCKVLMEFTPADSKWIESHLMKLREETNKLSQYLKHHPHISVNQSITETNSENEKNLISIKDKSITKGDNVNLSLGLSNESDIFDIKAENLEKIFRYRVRLLEQSYNSGWLVKIIVSSSEKNDTDVTAIRAIVSTSLLSLGFVCHWKHSNDKENKISTFSSGIFPSYMVPSLLSFPTRSFVGLTVKQRSNLDLNPPLSEPKLESDSIYIGNILWNGANTNQPLCISRKEMNRHTIVFGMTGGGKSNTVCALLSRISDIHYLIIEPVKGEYHVLPNIKRYTMVVGTPNSLKMNPFWFPDGVNLQYHIDSLKLIISSAFDLYAAMPNILEQCLYRVYVSCGWNIISSKNIYVDELPDSELYPTFSMLCDEIEQYLEESSFEGEAASNYRGALLSRLQSFTSGSKGALLNTTKHIDFEDWINQNIVVELDALADDADKAIVMGALLVQYFQYIKQLSTEQTNILKHLFILEEAHHLFKEMQQHFGSASASSQLVSMLNNLLAEIRAYGEGFIIVDQSPSSISSSVLKNTAVKIVHRVDYGEDIKLLQSALLLQDNDNVTASLEQGEALVRFGTMQTPVHVSIPYYPQKDTELSKRPFHVDETEGIADTILSNPILFEQLDKDSIRLMNFFLFGTNIEGICKSFYMFQRASRKHVSHCCGWDSVASFSIDVYHQLLRKCILRAAAKSFPRQYCLQRMICMAILRTNLCIEDSSHGGLTEKIFNLIENYKTERIFPRMSFYYQNHVNSTIRMMLVINPNLPEAGILHKIIEVLWPLLKKDDMKIDKQFQDTMRELFYLPLTIDKQIYFKSLALMYCKKIAN